jgi:hypothetical protein
VDWVRRKRSERIAIREVLMSELLRWLGADAVDPVRFSLVAPSSTLRRLVASTATGDVDDGMLQGQLTEAVARLLVRSRVDLLLVTAEGKGCVVVDGGWEQSGVWLAPEAARALDAYLARVHAKPQDAGGGFDLGLLRARVASLSLSIERAAAFVAAFGLVLLLHDTLARWQQYVVFAAALLGTYACEWAIRRLLRRWRPVF